VLDTNHSVNSSFSQVASDLTSTRVPHNFQLEALESIKSELLVNFKAWANVTCGGEDVSSSNGVPRP
jgi:hypothetical protein